MGLPNLTPEEEYLLKKFAQLKKKKKALQKSKEKTETPVVVKTGTKRDAPAEISHAPEDAKEIAKKLIASGEVKIKKDPVHREFKRAKGGERRPKEFQQQLPSNRNEQQARAAAMKNLYESFVPSSAAQNRRFSEGQGSSRKSWSEEPRKGNTIYVKGFGLTEKILQESFTKYGKVQKVNFEKDKSQGFVTFDSCEAAEKAIEEMNGMLVLGVHIKVALSRRQPNMGDTQGHHRRPGLGSRDSRGHSTGLQSQEAREIVSYDDL